MDNSWETIIKAAGEGGSITMLGKQLKDQAWQFKVQSNENAMADFLDDEDRDSLKNLSHELKVEDGFDEAFKIMTKKNLWCMRPLYVHPKFKDILLKKIEESNDNFVSTRYRQWQKLCE